LGAAVASVVLFLQFPAVWANPFEIGVGAEQIIVRSIGPNAVYSVGLDIGYAWNRPERVSGPAFLAPNQEWGLVRNGSDDAEQALSLSFCDESGILGQVFAVTGFVQLPTLGITRADLIPETISELTSSLSSRRLFWRDRRDSGPASVIETCFDPPTLRRVSIENPASAVSMIDAQPVSGVMQLLAVAPTGEPVAQVLTISDLATSDGVPPWVRHPALWYLTGILLSVIALVLGLFQGSDRRV
jgi:hypothetical protein